MREIAAFEPGFLARTIAALRRSPRRAVLGSAAIATLLGRRGKVLRCDIRSPLYTPATSDPEAALAVLLECKT